MEDLSPLSKSLEAGAPAEPREEHDDEPSSNAEEGEKNGDQDVVMTEVSAVVPKKRGRSPSPSPSPGRTDKKRGPTHKRSRHSPGQSVDESESQSEESSVDSGTCRHCGQSGHSKRQCPQLPRPNKFCYVCDKQGHTSKHCPEKAKLKALTALSELTAIGGIGALQSLGLVPAQAVPGPYAPRMPVNNQGMSRSAYPPYPSPYASGMGAVGDVGASMMYAPPVGGGGYDYGRMSERLCYSCGQRGHLSNQCPSRQAFHPDQSGRDDRQCFQCGGRGHISRDCPTDQVDGKCFHCGDPSHFTRNCPQPHDKICHKCGQKGHIHRDCPEKLKLTCFKCGEQGHFGRECPNPDRVICKSCQQRGHYSNDCPNRGSFDPGRSDRSNTYPSYSPQQQYAPQRHYEQQSAQGYPYAAAAYQVPPSSAYNAPAAYYRPYQQYPQYPTYRQDPRASPQDPRH